MTAPEWMRFLPGVEQPLPDAVPRQHAVLDTGARVAWPQLYLMHDVDEHLATRASWVPTTDRT